ncbi:hypothetical protein OG429_39150 [Streptomyces sp. NBC_00190]|uniref:hypothetical protein n=1 Tax=unclassified Streptomyces TaxID=2593676 RepID=UPI002E2C6514|nr:hypothetical protein [Streptomyces sp. NBC_00190]WSZ37692.1 hypothetical protein OG239_01695 [Streptomyces sp. NBC_00868]
MLGLPVFSHRIPHALNWPGRPWASLHHLGRDQEARTTPAAAHRALTELNHPRYAEAAALLDGLPDATA